MFKYQVLLLCCFVGLCAAKQVYFSKCGFGGFSCSNTARHQITYQCPKDENNLLFVVNDFNTPINIMLSLVIENCKYITVSFRCSGEIKFMESLRIQNVETLKIQQDQQYQTQLPVIVVLENITYVESIPSFAFSQIDKNSYNSKCFKSIIDLKFIHLENVGIGIVQSNGFHMPNNSRSIIFKNVTVDKLRSSAVLANMSHPHIFSMENSTVGIIESQAIQVTGRGMIIGGNKLGKIAPEGINSRVEQFFFVYNYVGTLQPYGISTASEWVSIFENTFEEMKSGSLARVRLGISPSNTTVKNSKYAFFTNTINHMENGCLHPANGVLDILPRNLFIKDNMISCSCENSAWLFSIWGQGHNISPVGKFYRNFLDRRKNNYCSSSCKLPVVSTKKMIKDGECDENITAEWLCETA